MEEKINKVAKRPDPVPASLLAGASFPLPDAWHADETTGFLLRDTIHSMLRRRNGWNYKGPGLYMITLTLADRSCGWLGKLEILGSKLPSTGPGARELARGCLFAPECFQDLPAPSDCRIALTPLGEAFVAAWREISANWPGVEALDLQVMPEHLHGVIRVVTPQRHPLGQIVGSFKARATGKAKALAEALGVSPERSELRRRRYAGCKLPSTGVSARELARGCFPPSLLAGDSLWSPGFTDSILWTAERRARATRYLKTNPYRLAIKRLFPDLFKVSRDLEVDLGEGRVGHFSVIGNHFLLEAPVLAQVQCSRSFFAYRRDRRGGLLKSEPPAVETAEFREKWALASKLASTGVPLVSPCISEGEREIARRAFEAGYKVITLANKGFSPLYKPGGKLFETCAEGNLLMLAPAKWPYQPGEKKMTRADALTLNQLASWIVEGTREGSTAGIPRAKRAPKEALCGVQARRHYSGAVVADVEKLALEAVGA